jgi:hypothetical protein
VPNFGQEEYYQQLPPASVMLLLPGDQNRTMNGIIRGQFIFKREREREREREYVCVLLLMRLLYKTPFM